MGDQRRTIGRGAWLGVVGAVVLAVGAWMSFGAGRSATTVEMTAALNYSPETVTIQAGETVRWTNTSEVVHTVTADPGAAADPSHVRLPEGASPFDSGNIGPGDSYTHTFDVPGTYRYFCIPHEMQGMVGTVVVE